MNFGKVGQKLTSAAGKTGLKIKKYSPEILLVVGIGTMGAAIIAAVKAARKHDELVDDHMERLEEAKANYILPEAAEDAENPEMHEGEAIVVSEKEVARKVRKEYCRTAAKFCKLYAPTAALMVLSCACFIGMHNIQAGRIAGLSGAYTALREYIDAYEKRNIELNGEENHRMCKYGYHEEVEEVTTDSGKKKKVKKLVPNDADILAGMEKVPFHDAFLEFNKSTSAFYDGRAVIDFNHLRALQSSLNDLLYARGWVVINDVRDGLGMPRTKEGLIEGWVRGCGEAINLGFEDPVNNLFLAGHNNQSIQLELNIHGNVYDLISKKEEKEGQKLEANING